MHCFSDGGVEFFLQTASEPDGALRLVLTDGQSTWSGVLAVAGLTPPPNWRSISSEDFRERLLSGLQGIAANDGLRVSPLPGGALPFLDAVQLHWTATQLVADLGIDMRLKQAISLQADPTVQGLRSLLSQLVHECESLQFACGKHEAEMHQLQCELDEMDEVATQVEETRCGAVDERRAHFLKMLNGKKRRMMELDAALERDAAFDELSEGYVSRGTADDDDDDDDTGEQPSALSGEGRSRSSAACVGESSGSGNRRAATAPQDSGPSPLPPVGSCPLEVHGAHCEFREQPPPRKTTQCSGPGCCP